MSDLQLIESALDRAARRLRLERAWRGLWIGLVAGAGVWLLALILYKSLPMPQTALWATGLAAVTVTCLGALIGWSRRVSPAEAARWVDRKQQLEERISTALEISKSSAPEDWRRLLLSDASSHVQNLDPRKLLPLHLPALCRWALILLLFGASLGFIPEYRNPKLIQKAKDTQNIQQVGKQMAQLVRRTMNQRQPALEPTRMAMDSVAQLGDQLAQTKLTRSEALKDLSSATEKLKQEAREMARSPALKKMEMAARASTPASTSQNSDLQKQIDSLSKSLGDKAAKPDALDQLRRELQKMKQAGKSLADKDASAGDAAREQLSQAVSELARKAESMGIPLPSLEEAIAALAANQVDQFLRDLNAAENDLEKLHAMAQALQQLQQQAEKVGKDLAEQLKNGQAQAAQGTLVKMIDKLQKAGLSPEDVKKMMEEVAKAVKPAGEYGKVAEHLKAAAAKMEKGERADAAQSLASASDELARMLEQLGDAQSLMSTLDALKRAQMAIGNGQSWALGEGLPGAGQGGGLGKGVGTWADDSQLMDITDVKDGWDNSGVERADEEARGVSDRGEGNLADSLVPTRVKGQMSPGGPMPSITLRGVSIRGQSTVGFKEAAMSAQSEAQSALSQDQVPRAYQGAVKDYFDDLK